MESSRTDKVSVLLIDDDEEDYLIAAHYLSKSASTLYQVEWISDYPRALAALLRGKHDIALVDYRLGQTNGISLLQEAINKGCQLPLLILTGQGDVNSDQQALDAGAMDYLIKGDFDATSLDRKIRYAIKYKQVQNQLKSLSEENQQLAEYDSLTGLANRRQFDKTLLQILQRCGRNNLAVGLLFLDLDNFKQINDTYGHAVGDQLLKQVAQRLQTSLRKTDFIFRFGGDEFTVVIEGELTSEKVLYVAQKIEALLQKPFYLNTVEVCISTSIGIATTLSCGTQPQRLIESADAAMYIAKKKAKQRIHFFTDNFNMEITKQIKQNNSLQVCFTEDDFAIEYCLQEMVAGKQLVGIEARMVFASKQDVNNSDLLVVAKTAGLLEPLYERFYHKTFSQVQPLLTNSTACIDVDIADSLWQSKDIIAWLKPMLQQYTFKPGQLRLDCSAQALMQDLSHSMLLIAQLQQLGISVVLDNFGLGRLVLAWLPSLELAAIKIPTDFLRLQTHDEKYCRLFHAMLSLGRHLAFPMIILHTELEVDHTLLPPQPIVALQCVQSSVDSADLAVRLGSGINH